MISPVTNLGGSVLVKDACCSENSGAPSVITAAAGLDNVKVTGQTIDRYSGTYNSVAQSAVVCTQFLAALTAAKTVSLAHEYQDSADGSTWNTAVVLEAATVYETGAGNKRGEAEFDVNLAGLARYIRVNVTLDLSHTSTDTASFATVVALGGFDNNPI